MQMWKGGTYKNDPDDPSRRILDRPGRPVLVTDESLIPNFSGIAVRDNELVGRRFSSAVFSFSEPISDERYRRLWTRDVFLFGGSRL